jgi:hypothetical protein
MLLQKFCNKSGRKIRSNFECYGAFLENLIAVGALTAALKRLSLLKRHHDI